MAKATAMQGRGVVHEAAVDQEGVHAFTQLQWNKGGPKRITTHL